MIMRNIENTLTYTDVAVKRKSLTYRYLHHPTPLSPPTQRSPRHHRKQKLSTMLLGLKTTRYLHFPASRFKPLHATVAAPALFSPFRRRLSASSSVTAMASSAATVVEHVVLFKVRDGTDPSKVDAMVSSLSALVSLDVVSHLTAGAVLRPRSAAAPAAGYTHLLHSRYRSKPDLAAYGVHPSHVSVVKELVLPICEDITAVDWVADIDGPMVPVPGSALRLTLAKPKDEGAAKEELLAALAEVKASAAAGGGKQVSYGENFSARAKGYSVGMLAMFPGVEELDAMEGDAVDAVKEKVRPLLESILALDFVVPPPPAAH